MAALGVLNVLFDGTKQFLMVAEDRSVYFGLEVIGIVCIWCCYIMLLLVYTVQLLSVT